MAYNTTGKSHSNGIEGEKTTKNLIENRTNMFGNSPKVEHRGGTSHKEDLLVNGRFKISAKNREGATGTYDYINTTKLSFINNNYFEELKKYMLEVKHSEKDKGHSKDSIKHVKSLVKDKFEELSNSALLSLTSSEIADIVNRGLHDYINDSSFYFSLTHKTKRSLIIFQANKHPLIKFLNRNDKVTYSLKEGKGRTSASIVFEDNSGQNHDFGLRLRLVTNNGLGALLAGKDVSSNYTSALVFKLQQDNPDKYIDQIPESEKEIVRL